MFNKRIDGTIFTSNTMGNLCTNIRGGSFREDLTFLSTLRALLIGRMPKDDSVSLEISSSNYSVSTLSSHSSKEIIDSMFRINNIPSGRLQVHYFSGDKDSNNACFDLISGDLMQKYPAFKQLERITAFFKNSFDILCFANEERKQTLVYVKGMDLRKYHYLQCATFAMLPWYFEADSEIKKDEMDLIQSLRGNSFEKYLECIQAIYDQLNIRDKITRQLLDDFEKKSFVGQLAEKKELVQRLTRDVESYNERIAERLREIGRENVFIAGLKSGIDGNSEPELMEYVLKNQRINVWSCDDNYMKFVVSDFIEFFDSDFADTVINNNRSYIYGSCKCNAEREEIKSFMTEVFLNQTLKIRTCAAYSLRVDGTDAEGVSRFNYGDEYNNCLPNPHIDSYSCLGSNRPAINDMLMRRDFIGATEQCSASAKGLNFSDSTVMDTFMSRIYSSYSGNDNKRYVLLPNGGNATVREAIEWIKKTKEGTVNE